MFSMTNTPDAQQMHKIANENVAVTKDRLKPPLIQSQNVHFLSSLSLLNPTKTRNRFPSCDIYLEPVVT